MTGEEWLLVSGLMFDRLGTEKNKAGSYDE